mgnify:CR=1 FL=1
MNEPTMASVADARNDEWQTVPKRRPKGRRKTPVIGAGPSDPKGEFLGAPVPSREIFVYRAMPTVSEATIVNYLKEKDIEPRAVKQFSRQEAKFRSFVVKLRKSDFEKVMSSEFWPTGVLVRRFFPHKSDHGQTH